MSSGVALTVNLEIDQAKIATWADVAEAITGMMDFIDRQYDGLEKWNRETFVLGYVIGKYQGYVNMTPPWLQKSVQRLRPASLKRRIDILV